MQDCLIGLARSDQNYVYARGHIVRLLQENLDKLGFDMGVIDGVFGKGSSAAVAAWQEQNNRTVTGEISRAEYELITGEIPDAFSLALQLTARFEGHGFGLAKGNFDGAILTWGIIGFTFRYGSFQEVIKRIDADDPNAVQGAFGDLTDKFRALLKLSPTSAKAAVWADDISEPGGRGILKPEWRDAFSALGATRAARDAQVALAREKYWDRAVADAKAMGIDDARGLALSFDIAVQCGGISTSEKATINARGGGVDGQARRELVANVVADATSNARWIEDVRSRKMTIASGDGEVHGGRFRTRDWGLDTEAQQMAAPVVNSPRDSVPMSMSDDVPAPMVITHSDKERFNAFFLALNLKHFRPDEFAYLGRRNANPNDRNAFGKNHLPPEELWPNMIRTAQIMDRLRVDLNASIRLTNIYRSPTYNAVIGGAEKSQHVEFTAVDFYCQNGKGPENWGATLAAYRASGAFRGGIGIYEKQFFVHLDTRGYNVDFKP